MLDWGATDEERARPLPGDDIMPAAGYQTTRAVTIRASAESVWPWLVQMGQDRAGFVAARPGWAWLRRPDGLTVTRVRRLPLGSRPCRRPAKSG
jgi:hypothetical protein